jgi:hypothetical protein|tara:strand:- start:1200 stop:1418 length:219 start_codon:yes stop_codon:yes gene_type:complete
MIKDLGKLNKKASDAEEERAKRCNEMAKLLYEVVKEKGMSTDEGLLTAQMLIQIFQAKVQLYLRELNVKDLG